MTRISKTFRNVAWFLFRHSKMMQYRICVHCVLLSWRQGTDYCLHLVQLCFVVVFDLYTMTCLHVSWHFTHVFFYAFFFFLKTKKNCNAMNINILQYKCSVYGKCVFKWLFLSKLESF